MGNLSDLRKERTTVEPVVFRGLWHGAPGSATTKVVSTSPVTADKVCVGSRCSARTEESFPSVASLQYVHLGSHPARELSGSLDRGGERD